MEIILPKELNNDKESYLELLNISSVMSFQRSNVVINYKDTIWLAGNLLAILGAISENHQRKSFRVSHQNMQSGVRFLCEKNGFMPTARPDTYSSTIRYEAFNIKENKKLSEYISTEFIGKRDFPHMSERLEKSVKFSLEEIVNNAYEHGKTDTVFTCGQHFYRKKILAFTIVDLGRTIKTNFDMYFESVLDNPKDIPSNYAINWATKDGSTTKTGKTPGGLGLGLIRDFIGANKGIITIISGDGYWTEKNRNIKHELLDSYFPGTIVTIEINVNDDQFYYFRDEETLNNKEY